MNSKSKTPNATIAFTLPVSCQICLGKVKQPVVCPNQHVFCGPCMELWLQRNQQCPACRVFITEENPCRKVLGGLSPETAVTENFCQKELRRARMELIYKDYENEIDRLEAELEAANQDNKELRNYLHHNKTATPIPVPTAPSEQDRSTISLLNNKLKDAMQLYEKVQNDLDKYMKENSVLKGKNIDLERENQTLRLEMVNRSPRRFGRFTVATLESKLEASEKQIEKLQKALERSDLYIEDLEKQLKLHHDQVSKKPVSRDTKVRGSKVKDTELDFSRTDSNLNDSELPSRISNISELPSEIISDIQFDDSDMLHIQAVSRKASEGQSSFSLDIPSPVSKSSKQYTDTDMTEDSRGQEMDDTFVLPKPSASKIPESTLASCKKKLRFTFKEHQAYHDDVMKDHSTGFMKSSTTDSILCGSNAKGKVRFSTGAEPAVPDSGDLNVSMTPDLEDCFRIMDEAERKLEERQQPLSLISSAVSASYPLLTSNFTSVQSAAEHSGLVFPRSTQVTASMPASTLNSNSQCRLIASESGDVNSMGDPVFARYPRMHSLSQNLATRSDVVATSSQTQNGLFPAPDVSQSNPASHLQPPVSSLLARNSSSLPLTTGSCFSTSCTTISNKMLPVGMPTSLHLQMHSLGGSTLSQPAQSSQQSVRGLTSAAQSNKTIFPTFSISQ